MQTQPQIEEYESGWIECPHCQEKLSLVEIHISEYCPFCDEEHGLEQ